MKQWMQKGLMMIGILLCFCILPVVFGISMKSKIVVNNGYTDLRQTYEMKTGEVIEQKIYVDDYPIEALGIYAATNGEQENTGTITVEVAGTESVEEHVINISDIDNWSEMKVPVKRNNSTNQWVTIRIKGTDIEQEGSLYFLLDNSTETMEKASINGMVQDKSLCMKYVKKVPLSLWKNLVILIAVFLGVIYLGWYFYSHRENKLRVASIGILLFLEILFLHFYQSSVYYHQLSYISKLYFVVIGILTVAMIGLLWCFKKKIKFEWAAAFCVFCFGMVYLLVLPAFSAPDEPAHFATAYKISNQLLFQTSVDDVGHAMVRQCDNNGFNVNPSKEVYSNLYGNILDNKNLDTTMVPQEGTLALNGSVIGHLPGAIGITIARAFHWNNSLLLLLGRMMGLIFYTVIIYQAIKKIPFGKMILFVISMFPMMLEEISSFGYDLIINGFAFFLIAYMMDLIYEKEIVQNKDIIIVSVVLFLFTPCKAIYVFIACMWFLIPKDKFVNIKNRKKSMFIVLLSGLVPTAIMNLAQVSNMSSNAGVVPWINERGYAMGDILENIPHGIFVFINTLIVKSEYFLDTMVGQLLGWFDISISSFIITGFVLVFVLELFRPVEKYKIEVKERVCCIAIAVVVSCAVIAAMWLSWTPISYAAIEGVQGRYFMPIIPLVYLAVANQKKIQIKSSAAMNMVLVCMLNIYAVLDILKVTFGR